MTNILEVTLIAGTVSKFVKRVRVKLYSCAACGHTYTLPDIETPSGFVGVDILLEYECGQKSCSGTLELIY